MADTIKLNWRKSETHGLRARPRAARRSATRSSRPTTISSSRPTCSTAGCRAQLQADAPKVVETEEGHEVWQFDGKVFFQVGLNAVVGRKREDWKVEPTRFEEMRPGCYDVDARVRDMDINGVWASVNFPSQITGFCGSVFSRCSDPELGLAVTRAWNDWFYDEWYSRASRSHRADGHHVPRRRRAGRRRDPPQRGARLHRGDAARDAAPHRDGADLLDVVGSDHRRVRGDRHGDLPARRLDRRGRHAGRRADGAARRDAVRSALARARARSGCGRATRCSTPISRSS